MVTTMLICQTREEYVAAQLRTLIIQGAIAPGEEIDQSKLAERLGVSRSPVRDAVRRLAAEGLICINPHKQAFVPLLSRDDVAEIYRILASLEGLATLMAVPKMTAADVQSLRELHQQMRGAATPEAWAEQNELFHSAICTMAHSPRLLQIIENLRTLRGLASPYVRRYVADPANRAKALEGHLRIVEACARGDAALAQRESEQHLIETWTDIATMVEA